MHSANYLLKALYRDLNVTFLFSQYFNSRSCQLVLGAGALQVVGLKTITTKNLGMDLDFNFALTVHVPFKCL